LGYLKIWENILGYLFGANSQMFAPRFREAHAIAAMFHLNDELAAKLPVLNGQINEGWQEHYKHPVHINDILQPPSTCENTYEEEEIDWLQKTVRYYVSQMSEEQREEKGITAVQASRILKVTRRLPCRPMASTADGRDSAAVTAGLASAGRRARGTTPRPQNREYRRSWSQIAKGSNTQRGGIDNDIDMFSYICIHKFYSSNFHFPVRAQAAAARAVPGRDIAGNKVHEDDVLQDDDGGRGGRCTQKARPEEETMSRFLLEFHSF
jgi:hypothetical protein